MRFGPSLRYSEKEPIHCLFSALSRIKLIRDKGLGNGHSGKPQQSVYYILWPPHNFGISSAVRLSCVLGDLLQRKNVISPMLYRWLCLLPITLNHMSRPGNHSKNNSRRRFTQILSRKSFVRPTLLISPRVWHRPKAPRGPNLIFSVLIPPIGILSPHSGRNL